MVKLYNLVQQLTCQYNKSGFETERTERLNRPCYDNKDISIVCIESTLEFSCVASTCIQRAPLTNSIWVQEVLLPLQFLHYFNCTAFVSTYWCVTPISLLTDRSESLSAPDAYTVIEHTAWSLWTVWRFFFLLLLLLFSHICSSAALCKP